MLLDIQDVSLRFGGVHALSNVSFSVAEREICGVIGPNGAGKTSLFNALSRIYDVTSGAVRFAGQDLLALPPHQVGGLGIARTFQNLALFDRQTVRWNVRAGRFRHALPHLGGALLGTRKRVELARALAMSPTLLLLDEPAAGLNHEEVRELEHWIRDIRDTLGVSVLLIEHHMNLVMRTSDHVVVLDFGRKIADGAPAEVAHDVHVQAAYLGAPA